MRRSKAAGYLVPLSGGIDSCATATIVFSMCRLVVHAIKDGNKEVIADVQRIAAFSKKLPDTPEEFCNQIFHTVYMGMANQSSKETRQRAKDLANRIGSYHTDMNIDDTFHATKDLLTQGTGFEPKFKVHGGSVAENCMLFHLGCCSCCSLNSPLRRLADCLSGFAKHPGPQPHGYRLLLRANAADGSAATGRRQPACPWIQQC